jgi:molybdate transport system substrate-binding protein
VRAYGWQLLWVIGLLLTVGKPAPALASNPEDSASRPTLILAVANSFRPVAELIARDFSASHDVQVQIASASSGVLTSQIINGAPFDLLLSADSARPTLLVERGIAVAESRQSYAHGILVFWWPPGGSHRGGLPTLADLDRVSRLAIANPRTAPYGEAAEALLRKRGLWQAMQPRLVRGAGASQAYQFVASGNIAAGLLPLSLLLQGGERDNYLVIPESLYSPLDHQLVIIKRGQQALAQQFIEFLLGPGQQRIADMGFRAVTATSERSGY